ncbi:3-hydroxyisobutyryl-CoA hydrolase, mitochondrial-like [Notothenia coriiceps]|uniref:3-hydroxyisobutyryl-CoA hydrolase n=1 Tax=Notothenia coriiceps TaxID=8208 RepID=A0A6I9Q252_9TELE|nr:PREDICTED: 3-hydroxyisobutyryl-CoA hydrolase, mitochondrial-like [Notothenia coriiceps]
MKSLERLVLKHLRTVVAPSLDPLQFAYQPRIGVEDAIIFLLPALLSSKLLDMQVDAPLVSWITNYLTARPQYVKLQNNTSDIILSSTGAPQGTVLSPFLFTVYTSDFRHCSHSCHLQKFSDDSAIVGCIIRDQEAEYRSVVDSFVECEKIPELEKELVDLKSPSAEDISRVLDSYQNQSALGADKPFVLEQHMSDINRLFSSSSVEGIVQNLKAEGSEFANTQAKTLSRMSPTSLKITYRQLQAGAALSLQDVLVMEYRLSQACMRGCDFYEGVRSVLIDKDQNPKWNPSTLEEVSEESVEQCFSSLGEKDLML